MAQLNLILQQDNTILTASFGPYIAISVEQATIDIEQNVAAAQAAANSASASATAANNDAAATAADRTDVDNNTTLVQGYVSTISDAATTATSAASNAATSAAAASSSASLTEGSAAAAATSASNAALSATAASNSASAASTSETNAASSASSASTSASNAASSASSASTSATSANSSATSATSSASSANTSAINAGNSASSASGSASSASTSASNAASSASSAAGSAISAANSAASASSSANSASTSASNAAASAASISLPIAISSGGTGATTAIAGLNALLPSQTSQSNKALITNGTTASWNLIDLTANVTNTLPLTSGGTGATTRTAAINNLLPPQSSQANKVAMSDGTNVSWQNINFANGTGTLPINNGGTGLSSIGSSGQVLTVNPAGTALIWSTPAAGGVTAFNTRTGSITLLNTDVSGITGTLNFTDTTNSGGYNTGAITTQGGVGIALNANIGGNMTVAGSIATGGTISTSGNISASGSIFGTSISSSGNISTSGNFAGTTVTQTPGNNSSTLASTEYVYEAISNTTGIGLSNTNITLTASQYSTRILKFIGTLTNNIIITLPTKGAWIVVNQTSGSFSITLSNGTGSTLVLPSATSHVDVFSDSALGVFASAVSSVGITSSDLTVTSSPITVSGNIGLSLNTVPVNKGGTGATTANAGLNALLPSQTSHSGYVLSTDGTNTSWLAVTGANGGTVTSVGITSSDLTVTSSPITVSGNIGLSLNTVPVNKGGTGATTANAGLNALLPSQTGNATKVLTTDGTNTSWTTATGGGGGGSGQLLNVQVFTSSGTYTPTSGTNYCIVEMVGGGGGGGATFDVPTNSCEGSGGGAGGYVLMRGPVANFTGQTVTIGAGGAGGIRSQATDWASVNTSTLFGGNGGDTSFGVSGSTAKGGKGGTTGWTNSGNGFVAITGIGGGFTVSDGTDLGSSIGGFAKGGVGNSNYTSILASGGSSKFSNETTQSYYTAGDTEDISFGIFGPDGTFGSDATGYGGGGEGGFYNGTTNYNVATGTLTSGSLTSISLTTTADPTKAAGCQYKEAPIVYITGDGTGATATANITAASSPWHNYISSFTVTNGGSGYTTVNITVGSEIFDGGSGKQGVCIVYEYS